ncbi:PREDICTED: TIR domain-containing adapter molecule 1 [Ficedula albicollis]|uniref:TIR domain-containing adapter molecule 1 n=1 Tax=Ficedula albicollis TaxID=59894 RepID=UPI000359E0B7|nr:PREDICTED: TIR domain-containing adapter molecule 1 [Ficedula albicollis]
MAESAELLPSFEDVFNILCQAPPEKLLSLKHKLHSRPGPCSKVLQAMVLLALGQETNARICLDALRDDQAAQYIQQTKLGAAGVQEEGAAVQPPQLDAAAMALLAQVCTLLAQEKLCSAEARDRACQAATKASQDTQQGTLNNVPAKEQDRQDSAASGDSGDGFRTLRSQEDTGFPCTASPHYVLRSSPVQIRGNSDPSGPQTLCSEESSSLPSCLEISASPTAAFHTQPSVPETVPWFSSAGHLDGDTQSQGPQESSWASTPSSPPGQDTAVSQPEEALQASPCHPTPLPVPETPLPSEPVQSSDVPSTVTEPHTPRDTQDGKQDEKPKDERMKFSTGVPDPRAAVDTAPAHRSIEDCYIPGIPCNSAPAYISTCSLPPPTYSFSSTLPPLQESHSNLSHLPPLCSSPSPGSPALQDPAVDPSEPEFFTFVVLHASEDELVAHRVKNLLESMGVSNGATLSEFLIPGRSQMTCFQEAMENSAFKILLLTKNFPCNLCLFQTGTALIQSIQDPSKQDSVIPFLPRSNALEHSQIPGILSVLVKLSESSPFFSRNVHRTFSPERIREKRAQWEQMQRRRLQAQQRLAALSLGSRPWAPPAPWPAEPSAQPWCPPAPMDPPPAPQQLPPGQYSIPAGQGGIPPLIIQHARMVQIGNHNVMEVGTAPGDSQEQARHHV